MILKAFVEALRTETLGFGFGKPWRYGEHSITCVVPIIRSSDEERKYITSFEANGDLEIKDTGSIDKVDVTNKGKKPIFMRVGEILSGDTQERSLVMSRVVYPGKTITVNVVCVHASKPISGGTSFKSRSIAPERDVLYVQACHNQCSAEGAVNQSLSWNADKEYYGRATSNILFADALGNQISNIRNDDLTSVHEKVSEVFEDVIKDMPLIDNQIGFALIDMSGFHSLDVFDLHESWKKVKEIIAGKESLKLSEQEDEGVFEYKPDVASKKIKDVLEKGYDEKVIYKDEDTRTVTFEIGKCVGEAVLLNDQVIHLLLSRKEDKAK